MLLRWFRLYLVLYFRLSTLPMNPMETPIANASSACEIFFWFRICLTFYGCKHSGVIKNLCKYLKSCIFAHLLIGKYF